MLYLGIFIISFVGISLWNFYSLTHPLTIQTGFVPGDFNLQKENVTLKTSDNVSIAGWHIPSRKSPEQVLLILHGYPADKSDLIGFASTFYPDFSLLLIDFRYFGESAGNASALGIQEARDVKAALDFLEQRDYKKIGVFGFSYGGAAALTTAADDNRIDAVASYGAFANLRTLGYDAYRNLWILKYPLFELMNVWSRFFFGAWAHSVSPEKKAAHITTPVFIGHTEDDTAIPVHHAEKIIEALEQANAPMETYIAAGATHQGLPSDLEKRLLSFFKKNLK